MRKAQVIQLVFVVVAAVIVFSFVRTSMDGEHRRLCKPLCELRPEYADRNRVAPDFELPKLGGGTGRLSDYRGKVVIMNFWTKSCQPCLEEMPSLAILASALKTRDDITLITVSTDETVEDVNSTLRSVLAGEPPFPVFVDSDSAVVGGKFGTRLFPETWFIDPSGVIRARIDGARDWSGPLALDVAQSLATPLVCPIRVHQGQPEGPWAWICDPNQSG